MSRNNQSHHSIQFGRPSKKSAALSEFVLAIDNLSIEGSGVGKHLGKTVFVEGAIPGEEVQVKIDKTHKSYDQASIINIEKPSAHRIEPACEHYQQCGGCQLQHIEVGAQLAYKEQAVLSLLKKTVKAQPIATIAPLTSAPLHYRRSARIGINQRKSTDTNQSIVGFRRRFSNKLLQVSKCIVLPEHISGLFDQLRESIDQIENAKSITHIEYQQGEEQGALTFRCKSILKNEDIQALAQMLSTFNLQGFLRYDDKLVAISADKSPLYYSVDALKIAFQPGDFLQVNQDINTQMISRAIDWLALTTTDKVLDLFSGLGNFSLPIAKRVQQLIGVEGSEDMVQRANDNAHLNQIDNCQFFQADLASTVENQPWLNANVNKLILDPPRSGASELISNLFATEQSSNISHILYVACDPSSLARDAKHLYQLGYQIEKFCVMDMFPNTTHIESMALFTKATVIKTKKTAVKTNSKKKKLFA
jgi:23S rRNA (uracil1939-C5)-methyltransferase